MSNENRLIKRWQYRKITGQKARAKQHMPVAKLIIVIDFRVFQCNSESRRETVQRTDINVHLAITQIIEEIHEVQTCMGN
jgi:hypothetical protein